MGLRNKDTMTIRQAFCCCFFFFRHPPTVRREIPAIIIFQFLYKETPALLFSPG